MRAYTMIWWALGILVGVFALLGAVPLTRRAMVIAFVATRRILIPWLFRRPVARGVRLAFEDLGPAYIKFGQMIASSPTAFPKHVTEEFAKCLDEVRPIPVKQVWHILETELGDKPENIFRTIESEPLASASIAQVHGAELESGAPVVIKVQRPGIRSRVQSDLAIMELCARIVSRFSKLLRHANIVGVVRDFRGTIIEEMDFTKEADNIEAFNALLKREGLLTIARAPRVERSLTTERVLTMERFYGCRIDNKTGVDSRVDDPEDMLRATSEVFWSCVFLGGFFHGDIHAGNIMVLDDGRLGYLDFGIFGRFSDSDRAALADWLGAMVSGNGEQLARAIYDMGAIRAKDLDWDAYVADVTEVFLPLRALTVDKPEMLEQFFPKLRDMGAVHDVHLPSGFILILKQLTYFGRYVMMHAPQFNENLDPKSQQTFVKIFVKYNAMRAATGAQAIAITPSA